MSFWIRYRKTGIESVFFLDKSPIQCYIAIHKVIVERRFCKNKGI